MNRLGLLLPFVILAVVGFGSSALGADSAAPPELTQFDIARADITVEGDVTNLADSAIVAGGVTPAEAVLTARSQVDLGVGPITVLRGEASQFAEEEPRPVLIVVAAGGTFPLDGPPDGPVSGTQRSARITGIIVDAATGEFLRGFMFS